MDDLMYDVEWTYEGNTFTATVHADHGKALLDRLKAGGAENVIARRIPTEKPAAQAQQEPEHRGPKPGDLCRIIGNYEVAHLDCDEFADGVVTDVRTGKIVRRLPKVG